MLLASFIRSPREKRFHARQKLRRALRIALEHPGAARYTLAERGAGALEQRGRARVSRKCSRMTDRGLGHRHRAMKRARKKGRIEERLARAFRVTADPARAG